MHRVDDSDIGWISEVPGKELESVKTILESLRNETFRSSISAINLSVESSATC